MPIPSAQSLKIGTIVDKTLAVIERNIMPMLIFAAGLTVANAAIKYFTLDMTRVTDALVIAAAGIVVGIVANYLVLDAIIRRTGLLTRTNGDVFIAYCVMSVLSTLGVMGGMILLIIPGLVILSRWIIAAPLVIGRGEGATRALGESWERTKGGEWQILMAWLLLLLGPIAVIIACGILFKPEDPVGIVISQLFTSLLSVISVAMSVAIYGLLETGRSVPSPA